VLIPMRDRLFVARAETEAHRRDLHNGWAGFERDGFDATAARAATLNCAYGDGNAPIQANHLLSASKQWAEIRYGDAFAPSLAATVELAVTRRGTVHCLALWFEATLAEDIVFQNAPGNALVYKRTVLPLLEPVRVAAGDIARVTLRADVGGDQWAWDTEIAGGPRVRQSTFLGLPMSPESLLRDSLTATPSMSSSGARAARILAMMDGARSVQEITDAIAAAEPGVRRDTIRDEVKSCVRRYAR